MAKQVPLESSRPTTRRKVVSATARRSGTSSMPAIPWRIPLGTTNYIILAAGIAVIILGYVLMSTGNADDPVNNTGIWDNPMAVTIAPILLVLGYCVIVPVAIFFRRKGEDGDLVEGESV